VAGHDARDLPLHQRRALLEELAKGWQPPLTLSAPDEAARWFDELPHTGIEGLVIKDNDQPHTPGARNWLKLKRRETVEVVCGAVVGPINRPSRDRGRPGPRRGPAYSRPLRPAENSGG
jgi:ATP-dependent DNA ligase